MKERGFEIVSAYRGKDITLPKRKTAKSAGYDLAAAEDAVIGPGKTVLVPTGLKAYMKADEVLCLYVRSSLAVKRKLALSNSVGIIDADYYDNDDNEGHIFVALSNFGEETARVARGERIAQGIFQRFCVVDGDAPGEGETRGGGFGSTGSK